MNEESDQNGVIKKLKEWNVEVGDKQYTRDSKYHGFDVIEENNQLENFVYWDINGTYLSVIHPTKFTILRQENDPMPFRVNKFPEDFEPSKTVVSERISSDVAAIGNETTVLFESLPTEVSIDLGFTDSRGKPIINTKQELMTNRLLYGAECGMHENLDQIDGLQVDTVGLSLVPNTEWHTELPSAPMIQSDSDCMTGAMKSKYENAGIKAVNNTLRSKGFGNGMIEEFFANLTSIVTKGKLKIVLRSSINLDLYGNDANTPIQNEGCTFFTVSRITGKHPDLSSSIVNVTNAPGISASNLHDRNDANNLTANGRLQRFESKDVNINNQPWYNYTNLTSNYTIIGNNTEIQLPCRGNTVRSSSQAGNAVARYSMTASNLVFQTPQNMRYLVFNNLTKAYPDVLSTTGAIAKSKHTSIINYCQDLRNKGEFQKHQRVLDYCRLKVGQKDPDLLISFNLEEALALINKSDVTAANKSLETLKTIAVKAKNSSLLLGRIYVFMANIDLRQKDYKQAIKMLDIASNYLEYFASGDEKTFLCYIYGVTYMMHAGECQSPDEELENRALQYFDLYLQHAKIHEGCGYFVRRGINYVMFQKASIYLRTYNNVFRDCQVSKWAVEMAKECLKFVEDATEFAKEHATKIKIISIKSDIAYREEEFGRARNILMEGIALSKDEAFIPFIVKEALEERLAFLKKVE
eukprot:Seg1923.4 transcript_id=Seg1923.4/GoldUCD/mRNA.D3Y31 product="hypothetical protein" protein_id=Seg1923.4/GoldUCD/D3Y31